MDAAIVHQLYGKKKMFSFILEKKKQKNVKINYKEVIKLQEKQQ